MDAAQAFWGLMKVLFGIMLISALLYEMQLPLYHFLSTCLSKVLGLPRDPSHEKLAEHAIYSVNEWQERLLVLCNSVLKVSSDFVSTLNFIQLSIASHACQKSRRYYVPWSRTKPVIIRSPDHMQELSEATELSQRAVYADVSTTSRIPNE